MKADKLLNVFNNALSKELLTLDEKKELFEKAKIDLKIYYNSIVSRSDVFKPVWLEKFASTTFASIPLLGFLDKVEIINAEKGYVRIVDYKTGRARTSGEFNGKTKPNEETIPGLGHKYKFQLYFYKLLFDNNPLLNKNSKYIANTGKIEFTEPAKGKSYLPNPLYLEYKQEELETVKQIIIDVWSKIQSLEFLD